MNQLQIQLKTEKMVKSIQFIARQGLFGWPSRNDPRTRFFYSRRMKWEPTEIDSIVGESNFRMCRQSHAASSVPSDTSNDRKGKKRVSKEERRAMAESFVNKYRAMNAGKFPTLKRVRAEVGGSYYTVRELVQELEYKSKGLSSTSSPTESAYVSSTKRMVDGTVHTNSKKACLNMISRPSSRVKHIEANVGLQSFSSAEEMTQEDGLTAGDLDQHFDDNEFGKHLLENKSESINMLDVDSPSESDDCSTKEHQSSCTDFVAPDNNLLKEEVNQKHPPCSKRSRDLDEKAKGDQFDFASKMNSVIKWETGEVHHLGDETDYDKQQKASFDSQFGLSGRDHVEEEQLHGDIEKPSSDSSSSQEIDADFQKKSTLWNNLKSFTDGIMSLWKKL